MIKKQDFPAVMVIEDLFGIEEGTILKFDPYSGKYVSIEEDEEVADDYFYSGSAIAIDPYIVLDNVQKGEFFSVIEEDEPVPVVEPEPIPEPEPVVEAPKVKKGKKAKVEELVEKVKQDEPTEVPPFPEYTKQHPLVVDCSCGHRNLLQVIQAPGVNFTLMAEQETSFVELTCKECGASLKLWFAPDVTEEDEPTKKKGK